MTDQPDACTGLGFDPEELRARYRAERDRRLRPDGSAQYIEPTGDFGYYVDDPHAVEFTRQPGVDDVDAVVICTPTDTHADLIERFARAGKAVFCEKPLAPTQEACRRIVDAEVAAGRRLVQVGFNRRYDPAHRALKAAVDGGAIGAPLLVHCAHRNASVPPHYTRDMSIADTTIHEIDELRWLFGQEIVAVQVLTPRKSSRGGELQDPLLVLFEMADGVLVVALVVVLVVGTQPTQSSRAHRGRHSDGVVYAP